MQDLYTDKCKAFLTKIKDELNKMEIYTMFIDFKSQQYKNITSLQINLYIQFNPIKNQSGLSFCVYKLTS